MIIQLLLLAGFFGVALTVSRLGTSARHHAVRRLVAGTLLAGSGLAVLFPDAVTAVAHLVGVGRGTDLVLYLFVLASGAVWVGVYRRMVALDDRVTRLVRALALAEAPSTAPVAAPPAEPGAPGSGPPVAAA